MSSASRQRARHSAPKTRSNTSYVWIALVGVIAVVGVALIFLSRDEPAQAGAAEIADEVTVDGDPIAPFSDEGPDVAVGQAAPAVSSTNPDGEPLTIDAASTGNPTIVVLLAHSCNFCDAELPDLVEWESEGLFDGVDVVAVSTNQNEDLPNWPASAWLGDAGWPFPVLADDADQRALIAYGASGTPFAVAIDSSGTVRSRVSGRQPEEVWRQLVADAKSAPAGEETAAEEPVPTG